MNLLNFPTFSILSISGLALALTFQGCGNPQVSAQNTGQDTTSTSGTSFIPVDSANKMISSYITSLGGDESALHSLVIDGDALRQYLSDTSIHNVKVMFAHTLEYINNGQQGQDAGYNQGELTVVIAACNSTGDYVLFNGLALDMALPCPVYCPPGTGSSDLITIP